MYVEYPLSRDQDSWQDDDRQSTSELLDLVRDNIKRLRDKGILRTELYSYIIDLIEEDVTFGQEDVWSPYV